MTPADALSTLISAPLFRPTEIHDRAPGLYVLHDHTDVPRYIGMTMNLRHRISSNHCVGDLNSHKWVAAYNAGRLWHDPRSPLSNAVDGKIAKALRATLVRSCCRVRVLRLPEITTADLDVLEKAVRALAPDPMNDWNDQKSIPSYEPAELVDRLLDDLGWDSSRREAIERQAARWRSRVESVATNPVE